MNLGQLVQAGRTPCVLGIDDAPFERGSGGPVSIAGVVCHATRFEGMLWGEATQDGTDATEALIALVAGSKFAPQLHAVLLDGIALGGFNVVDLAALHDALGRPCIAVMRRWPDRDAMRRAMARLPEPEARWARVERAGPIHDCDGFVFQAAGAQPADAALLLGAVTDRGHVPEPLRLAHLIGSAVMTGVSSKRA